MKWLGYSPDGCKSVPVWNGECSFCVKAAVSFIHCRAVRVPGSFSIGAKDGWDVK